MVNVLVKVIFYSNQSYLVMSPLVTPGILHAAWFFSGSFTSGRIRRTEKDDATSVGTLLDAK
jgi:hypothetical protein